MRNLDPLAQFGTGAGALACDLESSGPPYGVDVQFRVPVPRIVCAVLSIPLLMVSCKLTGALAVMVTCPALLQVARPASSILATPVLELLQLKPSAGVRTRLELSVKMPFAVKPNVPLLFATAEAGFTLMLFRFG